MLKKAGFGFCLLISTLNSFSCDVCGSSSLGSSTVYNLSNQKMIGISYSYGASFYEDRDYEDWDYNSFKNTINLSSLWNLTKSLQAEVNIPYEQNSRKYTGREEKNSSFGDVQLGVNHFFRLGNDSTSSWMIRSSVISELPVVKISSEYENQMNMQSTSKSIDGIFSLGVLKTFDNLRIYANSKYKRSLKEYIDYRFGDTWINEVAIMYNVNLYTDVSLIPQVGAYKEVKDYDVKNNIEQHGTSSNNTFGKLGFQLSIKDWFIGGDVSTPISSKVIQTEVSQGTRINTFLIFKF